jgi:hypothetical protein
MASAYAFRPILPLSHLPFPAFVQTRRGGSEQMEAYIYEHCPSYQMGRGRGMEILMLLLIKTQKHISDALAPLTLWHHCDDDTTPVTMTPPLSRHHHSSLTDTSPDSPVPLVRYHIEGSMKLNARILHLAYMVYL